MSYRVQRAERTGRVPGRRISAAGGSSPRVDLVTPRQARHLWCGNWNRSSRLAAL